MASEEKEPGSGTPRGAGENRAAGGSTRLAASVLHQKTNPDLKTTRRNPLAHAFRGGKGMNPARFEPRAPARGSDRRGSVEWRPMLLPLRSTLRESDAGFWKAARATRTQS